MSEGRQIACASNYDEFVVVKDANGNAVELRLFGTADDYESLIMAIRCGVEFRDISRETLDALSGLAPGYTGKLLCIPPMRGLGQTSTGPLLQSAALKILVVEDSEALKKVSTRHTKRKPGCAGAKPLSMNGETTTLVEFMRHLGKRGGRARQTKMSAERRSQIARLGGKARWQKSRLSAS